jgi:hypothetical protein
MSEPAVTNLLAMPLLTISVITGTNEDWVDSIKYVVGDPDAIDPPQLDLRGIRFAMEVRHAVEAHEVILSVATDDVDPETLALTNELAIGDSPDFGYLLINIPMKKLKDQIPTNYVADIVGFDAVGQRRVIDMTIEIVKGVTR